MDFEELMPKPDGKTDELKEFPEHDFRWTYKWKQRRTVVFVKGGLIDGDGKPVGDRPITVKLRSSPNGDNLQGKIVEGFLYVNGQLRGKGDTIFFKVSNMACVPKTAKEMK